MGPLTLPMSAPEISALPGSVTTKLCPASGPDVQLSMNTGNPGARGMTRSPAIVRYPGARWPLTLRRAVRDHNPEHQLQSDRRPVYLIEINVLQFPFHGGRPGRVFAAWLDRCL